jgi:NodT family efflux transporter outer membrane factor (OMF) lipoprotein
VGVPSDLLERRPDIATAERQVAASNAQIGVARAAYFPSVTLSGSAGFESTLWRQLLDWPNRFWSVGPSLSQVLFDGGARRAATAQARALNDSQVASYRQTVLTALQSVEDNLVSLRILAKELIQQHKATVAAQHAVELSVVRFRNGVDSYVNVITAQNAFLANREAELQIVLKRLTASVNLINNLGGGWERSGWRETERMAQHPPSGEGQPKIPAEDATPGVANPPPVPEREILPDEIVKHNEDSMAPGEH